MMPCDDSSRRLDLFCDGLPCHGGNGSRAKRDEEDSDKNNTNIHAIKNQMLYSIILPTYNERENLPIIVYLIHRTFSTLPQDDYEVIIVDDSSPDGTLAVAERLQREFKQHIQIVSRPGKLGLGTAYAAGLKVSSTKSRRIILMDADLSHHPKFIPNMIHKMNETHCHVVSGTRYAAEGGVVGWDLRRKVMSQGANVLADILLQPGNKTSDLTGSFRLYQKDALKSILPRVTCKGYAFQMEIIILAQRAGYKIEQVPITFVDRLYGESKLGTKEIVLYLKGLVTLFLTT
ncbi:hypothetical protein MPSEU_000119000 [Mayamaea pseudoterrestris]|nr:hypothetical protein MPSEU_000119000 [Mayamaea pseudoterrestris]